MSPFETQINIARMRRCQREARAAAERHFSNAGTERCAILQLPTGTGKTALIASLPFGLAKQRALVLTPNIKLARDIADKLDIVKNPHENVFRQFELLSSDDLDALELFVLRLENSVAASDLLEHHLIVSNYQQLQDLEKWFAGQQDAIDLIIIDEAHHQAATTYQEIVRFFPKARIVGLTATPFRSDGKRIEGAHIYRYSFREAVQDGVIRNIRVSNVAPEQIALAFTDQDSTTYTLEEMLKLKEEAWFNRGIALSQDCCDSIARKAKEMQDTLRHEYPNERHEIIASAISKRHAREYVKPAFLKLGLKVGLVSSDPQDMETNDETFENLKRGKLDVIVHIGMLGEGFDHPSLGVAAIFRPYKSLNPYIQFVGRVLRTNGATPHCYVVSHLGLNQLARFNEFRLFDNDDQAFMQTLFDVDATSGSADAVFVAPRSDREGPGAVPVITEIGDGVVNVETTFVDEKSVSKVRRQFEKLGTQGQEAFLRSLGVDPSTVNLGLARTPRRARPIDRKRASQNLLNEREKSIATDVLKDLGLGHRGRDFNRLFDNFSWVKKHVSKKINAALNIKKGQRKTITNEMYADADSKGILRQVSAEALEYFRTKRESS